MGQLQGFFQASVRNSTLLALPRPRLVAPPCVMPLALHMPCRRMPMSIWHLAMMSLGRPIVLMLSMNCISCRPGRVSGWLFARWHTNEQGRQCYQPPRDHWTRSSCTRCNWKFVLCVRGRPHVCKTLGHSDLSYLWFDNLKCGIFLSDKAKWQAWRSLCQSILPLQDLLCLALCSWTMWATCQMAHQWTGPAMPSTILNLGSRSKTWESWRVWEPYW